MIAQDEMKSSPDEGEGLKPVLEDQLIETQHKIDLLGQTIHYTATTGTLVLREEDGTAKASFFFVAYTQNDIVASNQRPLTFSFNGGPGSSSVWLHLGILGPRRVQMDAEGQAPPPPYQLVDNDYSILDQTDLVFIDPVSTGYSRSGPDKDAKDFHGVKQDIESVAEFIRLYTSRYKRWGSPKYLIGESYGTTRAAGLAGHLLDEHGLYLNGIMLISVILNFQTVLFDIGNDLPFILYLPTYAATAWYHQRLSDDLQTDLSDILQEVEDFATGEYALSLLKGDKLSSTDRAQIAQRLARYTGLSPQYIQSTDLRINIHRFVKELLRNEGRTVGRFDSRLKGIDRDSAGASFDYDPSYVSVQGVYTALMNDYVRTELSFESDLPYQILSSLYQTWDYSDYKNKYLNLAETLREAMTKNPYLKVFVANGYYDLATPYFATQYTFDHLSLDRSLQKNISMSFYEAGHMMYTHRPSLENLRQDLEAFIKSASPN